MEWLNTVPDWIIEVVLAAFAGGLAAMAGWLLEGFGFIWGQFLGIVVMVVILGGEIQFGIGWLKPAMSLDARTEATIVALAPEVAGVLKAKFPADYADMVSSVSAALERNSGTLMNDVATATAAIRKKYSGSIASAGDQPLRSLATATGALYQTVLDDEGMQRCAVFALSGPAALGAEFSSRYARTMADSAVKLFTAEASGLRAPKRRAATPADWQFVLTEMSRAGAPGAYLGALRSPDPKNQLTCLALIALMQAIEEDRSDTGIVVLANFLAAANAN